MKKLLYCLFLILLLIGCPEEVLPIEQPVYVEWSSMALSVLNYTDEDVEVLLTYKDGSTKTQTVSPMEEKMTQEDFLSSSENDGLAFRLFRWFSQEIPVSSVGAAHLGVYEPSSEDDEYISSIQVKQTENVLYESTIYLDRANQKWFRPISLDDNRLLAGLPFESDKLDSMYIVWFSTGADVTIAEQISCYIGIFPPTESP